MTTLLGPVVDIEGLSLASLSDEVILDFFLDSDFEPFFLFVAEWLGSVAVGVAVSDPDVTDDVDAVDVGVFARPFAGRFFGVGSETPL